jgi:hypothetical protein
VRRLLVKQSEEMILELSAVKLAARGVGLQPPGTVWQDGLKNTYLRHAPQTRPRSTPTIAPGIACSCMPVSDARRACRSAGSVALQSTLSSTSRTAPAGVSRIPTGVIPTRMLAPMPNTLPRIAPLRMRSKRAGPPDAMGAAGRLQAPHTTPHTVPHIALHRLPHTSAHRTSGTACEARAGDRTPCRSIRTRAPEIAPQKAPVRTAHSRDGRGGERGAVGVGCGGLTVGIARVGGTDGR